MLSHSHDGTSHDSATVHGASEHKASLLPSPLTAARRTPSEREIQSREYRLWRHWQRNQSHCHCTAYCKPAAAAPKHGNHARLCNAGGK
jgi:hypothetical protein